MSAFCVFGMTDLIAKQAADKKRPPRDWKGEVKYFYEEQQEKIFKSGNSRQISPAYDAPQFCREWIQLANKHMKTRGLKIMCRGQKKEKNGATKINKRTKKPIIGWVPYED